MEKFLSCVQKIIVFYFEKFFIQRDAVMPSNDWSLSVHEVHQVPGLGGPLIAPPLFDYPGKGQLFDGLCQIDRGHPS